MSFEQPIRHNSLFWSHLPSRLERIAEGVSDVTSDVHFLEYGPYTGILVTKTYLGDIVEHPETTDYSPDFQEDWTNDKNPNYTLAADIQHTEKENNTVYLVIKLTSEDKSKTATIVGSYFGDNDYIKPSQLAEDIQDGGMKQTIDNTVQRIGIQKDKLTADFKFYYGENDGRISNYNLHLELPFKKSDKILSNEEASNAISLTSH